MAKPNKVTLRDVQKVDTRRRLIEAAAEVFHRDGYDSATIDQIATEAGASRATFYLHFKDKQVVLDELIAGYVERSTPQLEGIPGPKPTLQQVKDWIIQIGQFFEQEKVLVSVMTQVFRHQHTESSKYGLEAVDMWINALGKSSPAFAAAHSRTESDVNTRARAEILVIEVVWAASNVRDKLDDPFTLETLDLVATALHKFLRDPKFHSKKL